MLASDHGMKNVKYFYIKAQTQGQWYLHTIGKGRIGEHLWADRGVVKQFIVDDRVVIARRM